MLTVELGWKPGGLTGWGVFGVHLALAIAQRPEEYMLVLPSRPDFTGVGPGVAQKLLGHPSRTPDDVPCVRLCPLGNYGIGPTLPPKGENVTDVGFCFFEDTYLDREAVARFNSYTKVLVGSSWNRDLLVAAGVRDVRLCFQGVDRSLFHPGPKSGLWAGRFAIFSGGKLEFRKGQDIVVAAFRDFKAKHKEALLITAWYNAWPNTMVGIDAMGYVKGRPTFANGLSDLPAWLEANGIAKQDHIDLGLIEPPYLAQAMRECDCAVFPNRAEGGTNLVAMEAIACGLLTMTSPATGHADLPTSLPGSTPDPVTVDCPLYREMRGWQEMPPHGIAEAMELVWTHELEADGSLPRSWDWPSRMNFLLDQLA